jgi:hypothetical protein
MEQACWAQGHIRGSQEPPASARWWPRTSQELLRGTRHQKEGRSWTGRTPGDHGRLPASLRGTGVLAQCCLRPAAREGSKVCRVAEKARRCSPPGPARLCPSRLPGSGVHGGGFTWPRCLCMGTKNAFALNTDVHLKMQNQIKRNQPLKVNAL